MKLLGNIRNVIIQSLKMLPQIKVNLVQPLCLLCLIKLICNPYEASLAEQMQFDHEFRCSQNTNRIGFRPQLAIQIVVFVDAASQGQAERCKSSKLELVIQRISPSKGSVCKVKENLCKEIVRSEPYSKILFQKLRHNSERIVIQGRRIALRKLLGPFIL